MRVINVTEAVSSFSEIKSKLKNVDIYDCDNSNKAIKFIESRTPHLVIIDQRLLLGWGADVMSCLGEVEHQVELIVIMDEMSKESIINIVNNFSVRRIISTKSRNFNAEIISTISGMSEELQKNVELFQKVTHYEYVLEQSLVTSK